MKFDKNSLRKLLEFPEKIPLTAFIQMNIRQKTVKIHQSEVKNSLRTTNGNLYAYGANNPVKYTDPDRNSILSGLTKTIIGSAQVAIGTVGVLFCGAAATALVADVATFIDVLDDPLALALAAGATASTLFAVSGIKLTSEGLNEAADAVSEAAHNLIQNAKTPAAAASPNPLPSDDENDSKQSAKDSKKLDNKGAEKFSQEKGYKDAHGLKKDILRGQEDKTVGHYDI